MRPGAATNSSKGEESHCWDIHYYGFWNAVFETVPVLLYLYKSVRHQTFLLQSGGYGMPYSATITNKQTTSKQNEKMNARI